MEQSSQEGVGVHPIPDQALLAHLLETLDKLFQVEVVLLLLKLHLGVACHQQILFDHLL